MSEAQVDLTSCDTEPIHIIGSIQPVGALLAASRQTLEVTHVSQNLGEYLNVDAEAALGLSLEQVLGKDVVGELLKRNLVPGEPHLLRPWYPQMDAAKSAVRRLEFLPHAHDQHIVLEILNLDTNVSDIWQQDELRQRIISDLNRPKNVDGLAKVTTDLIREITGFDRVMIYRFAEDKHGQVIAESTNRDDSFLDMHYPASDIPEPARRHFTLNLIRAISDINATPVPIFGRSGEIADAASDRPLDLTYSKLRAVAPVHIEYLSNMGVGASMSISLVSNNQLWGLIACHHYAPLHLSSSLLRFCEMLGGTISSLLQNFENTTILRRSIAAERVAFDLERDAHTTPELAPLIAAFLDPMMKLFGAQALQLKVDNQLTSFGDTPVEPIDVKPLASVMDDGIGLTHHLSAIADLTQDQISKSAGAAYLELSEDGADYLLIMREQHEHVVTWAGKPEKVEKVGADGVRRLSPRGSFALWRQERLGHSKPFTASDRDVLRIVRRALFALNSLNRERAAMEAQKKAQAELTRMRLGVLEASRKRSMGELASALAHELNQPLSAISNYVNACKQELRNCGLKIPERVLTLMDEAVSETARSADLVRRLRSFISTGKLRTERSDANIIVRRAAELAMIASEVPSLAELHFDLEDDLPDVECDPVQIGQVVLNLVRNAMESMQQNPGHIVLTTRLEASDIVVSVRDTGPGIPADISPSLFDAFKGTKSDGMGLGLSLCRSIIEAHGGKIWHEASAEGADLRFSLPTVKRGRRGRN